MPFLSECTSPSRRYGFEDGYIQAKTISSGRVEDAARADYEWSLRDPCAPLGPPWVVLGEEEKRPFLDAARRMFQAAGLYVEDESAPESPENEKRQS
ncbi:hypothetical protein [Nesterenkonia rhizosphaerae]|uniref:Uncharacterized protein n=1 Tax=Nesterenkonia rhizosphaerae TaxID=1348272 RepID=A0ABP9G0U9_9MICC